MWLGKDMRMTKDMVNFLEFNGEGQIKFNFWDYYVQNLFLLNQYNNLMILDWTLRC